MSVWANTPAKGEKLLNFFEELKRRKVIRVAIVYAITAWLLVQVSALLFPMFGVPDWAARFVVIVLLIGFPIALILTWALELHQKPCRNGIDYGHTGPSPCRCRER